MSSKLFISYSHLDESSRSAFEAHLSQMKRNGHIETWSFRKILAGREWNRQIDKNLESADIVVFLVSSDFLASDYCYDVEVKQALAMHKSGRAIVVPVIVRHCDWKESPFAILQALPLDGKPVSAWQQQDEAWVSVVAGLKEHIKEKNAKNMLVPRQETIWYSVLSKNFYEWLNDTEIELTHRNVRKVYLEDVFVCPDLKDLNVDIDKVTSTINCEVLARDPGWKLIFGDEQSGKTSLAKHYLKLLLQKGLLPVWVQGKHIKSSNIQEVTRKAYLQQYTDGDWENFNRSERKVLLIDDFSDINLNRKYQNKFIEGIKQEYSFAIFLAIDSFQYVVPEISALDGFHYYEILRFGNLKRAELIEKWISIGIKESIDDKQLYDNVDTLKMHLDTFVARNIVPSKPIYLLSILQTFESFKPQQVELTSYGHCYQYLIFRALENANIKPAELDSYINILTDLARAIFENNGIGLDAAGVENFFQDYHSKYLKVDEKKVMDDLGNCRILCERDGKIFFRYRYIYYFYAAKYLAERLTKNNEESKTIIHNLLSQLHKEDCANIIIFITHHTKDEWVLDEIQFCLMELFQDYKEASLQSSDLKFMEEFLKEIPKLVIEQRGIEEERKRSHQNADKRDEVQAKIDEKVEKLEPTDTLAKINRTFKGIELIGQVVRNRYGSLEKATLKQIVQEAYGVGLRFLQFFLLLSDSSREEVISMIEHMLKENPRVANEQLEREARNVFLLMTYSVIYGVLSKIAMSIGSREADEVYREIEKENGAPAIKLINEAIELQFQKRINDKKLRTLAEEFKGNVVCKRILQEIIIQHIYMHQVNYKEKQIISEVLEVPMATQRALDLQKKLKI